MGSLAPTAAHAVKAQGVQIGTRRAGARMRQGHWVRGFKARCAPLEAVEDAEQLGDPRRKRASNHPASWVASHQGRVRYMVRIRRSATSASYSVLTVCRVRSCHARAHCVARSLSLAITPKNGYACTAGAQSRVEHHSTAPTTCPVAAGRAPTISTKGSNESALTCEI